MTVTRDIAATRQRVWDVLANGWTYSGWVVGQQPDPRGGLELARARHPHSALNRHTAARP
jgi:hypothetical protein